MDTDNDPMPHGYPSRLIFCMFHNGDRKEYISRKVRKNNPTPSIYSTSGIVEGACDIIVGNDGSWLLDPAAAIQYLCASCYSGWKGRNAICWQNGENDGVECGLPSLLRIVELWEVSGEDGVRTFVWLCSTHYAVTIQSTTILCGESDVPIHLLTKHLADFIGKRRGHKRGRTVPAVLRAPPRHRGAATRYEM